MISHRRKVIAMAGAMTAMLLAYLDQTIVATALPHIARDLHGLADMSLVFTVYMFTSIATTPLYGKLSDFYGRKYLFLLGIVIFLLASAAAGAAQSMWELIIA